MLPMVDGKKLKRLREERGWSQDELARQASAFWAGDGPVQQQAVNRMEIGKTKRSKYVVPIARALGIAPADLDPDLRSDEDSRGQVGMLTEKRDFRLYSQRSEGQGFIMSSAPVQLIARPTDLETVVDAYALIVSQTDMVPACRPGDRIWINPNEPPRGGGEVLLRQQEQGGPVRIVTLLGTDGDSWVVQTWSPNVSFQLLKEDWPICHAVVGMSYR